MNRNTQVVVGVLLALLGLAFILYRAMGSATLAGAMPIVVSATGVAGILAGVALLGKARSSRDRRP